MSHESWFTTYRLQSRSGRAASSLIVSLQRSLVLLLRKHPRAVLPDLADGPLHRPLDVLQARACRTRIRRERLLAFPQRRRILRRADVRTLEVPRTPPLWAVPVTELLVLSYPLCGHELASTTSTRSCRVRGLRCAIQTAAAAFTTTQDPPRERRSCDAPLVRRASLAQHCASRSRPVCFCSSAAHPVRCLTHTRGGRAQSFSGLSTAKKRGERPLTHGQLAYCMMSAVPSGSITPSARTPLARSAVTQRCQTHGAEFDASTVRAHSLYEPEGAKLTARSSTTLPSLSSA